MISSLIKILFAAAGLALYDLFIKNYYRGWLESQGKFLGFGESMLGYFIVMTTAYIVAWIVTRRMRKEE